MLLMIQVFYVKDVLEILITQIQMKPIPNKTKIIVLKNYSTSKHIISLNYNYHLSKIFKLLKIKYILLKLSVNFK
jgi:hypothetical protein